MMLCRLLSVDHSPEMVNVIQSSISGYPIPAFLLLLQPSRQEHTQNEETPIAKKTQGTRSEAQQRELAVGHVMHHKE